MIWYILIATFLFWGYFSNNPEKYYKVSMVVLFVFTAFRDTDLGDYHNTTYKRMLAEAPTLDKFNLATLEYEPGYTLLESIVKYFSQDFRVFQVVYTLLAIILLAMVIRKFKFEAEDKNLFLFVYFCMRFFINNFIILRQNIANMIIWYALLSGFGLIIVIISVYLAAQFHVTAYANIVTGCIYKWIEKIDIRKIYIVTMIISFVLLFSSTSTINNIINNFISFAGEKYTKYIISDEYVVGFNEIYYLLRIAFFGLFYWTYDTLEESNKKSLFCISAIAVILGSINVDIFSRFMEFYMIGIYAFMAISYKAFRRESQKYYLIILYLAMMVIMIRQLNIYGDGHLLNYKLFFGE